MKNFHCFPIAGDSQVMDSRWRKCPAKWPTVSS